MIPIATLGEYSLPVMFSYQPYVPTKRKTTTRTANAVVIQYNNPQIVHGEGTIPWTMEGVYPHEFKELFDLYNTDTPALYNFIGYWGEELVVIFEALDQPKVRGRLFSLSGMFQVIAVVTEYSPTCVAEESV